VEGLVESDNPLILGRSFYLLKTVAFNTRVINVMPREATNMAMITARQ
jgi:hypothetical protein